MIRQPAVSGTFYPADSNQLSAMINKYISEADINISEDDIVGLISPHAGYIYSGPIAAYGYKLLQNKQFDSVIVLAPSHRFPFYGFSIMTEGYYRTPLGDIPINSSMATTLSDNCSVCDYVPAADIYEHSLEVQLPFLQFVLKNDFSLIPIIIGSISLIDLNAFVNNMYEVIKDTNTLIIASTDLSHFFPYKKAIEIDKHTISYIESQDADGLYNALDNDAQACGGYPVTVLLKYTNKLNASVKILKYATSGDTAGDKNSVVGYLSAAVIK